LKEKDFVYVHVEAPDEAGHMGDTRLKIEAIEVFDEKIVGAILKGMEAFKRYKVLVLPDHPLLFLSGHTRPTQFRMSSIPMRTGDIRSRKNI